MYMDTKVYTPYDPLTTLQAEEVMQFLHEHLGEYGDTERSIGNAMDYAMKKVASPGGFILVARDDATITGAVVVNKTGMEGYIPENILVYIAVHSGHRGKGLGRKLMTIALDHCHGNVALHVEPDNPAKFLYEKLGFENKYLEMRYNKSAH